jgi:hypothetical protein
MKLEAIGTILGRRVVTIRDTGILYTFDSDGLWLYTGPTLWTRGYDATLPPPVPQDVQEGAAQLLQEATE